MVRASLQENGRRSCRRNGLNLTPSSFHRIVKDIKVHPYVLIRRQKLENADPPRRLAFCNWFLQTSNNDPNFLRNLIVSDEAIFSLNSEVNTRNVIRYSEYGHGHPEDHYVEFQQGNDQVMVWMGLTGAGHVLGPNFIRGNLNTREYIRIIRYHVVQGDFRRLDINRENMWWQQDGAPAHTSNQALHYLRGRFPGKVISKRGDWPWPPRSPDLSVCDFFLWGYLKHQIWSQHNQAPQNIRDLRTSIINAANNLQEDMIQRAFDGMRRRVIKCINVNGNAFHNE